MGPRGLPRDKGAAGDTGCGLQLPGSPCCSCAYNSNKQKRKPYPPPVQRGKFCFCFRRQGRETGRPRKGLPKGSRSASLAKSFLKPGVPRPKNHTFVRNCVLCWPWHPGPPKNHLTQKPLRLGCVCGVSSCGSLVGVVGEGVICRSGAFSDKSELSFDIKGPGATN